nr:reverse transcriptase domain-containing protein [Tanacetum cinerariifolium]
TTNLKNDIINFQQRFNETFSEAWDRFKDLLRKCPHHGFLELHQLDTFYNPLTQSDQDSLNAAASVVSKVNTTISSSSLSLGVTALTDIVKELALMNKANQQASVKAIEETCVTCMSVLPPVATLLMLVKPRGPTIKEKKLSLPELTPTRMTLELANQSVTYPVGVAEDVFVKVRKFYFLADFVVIDYDVDPRVPLILGRPFLRTPRALINVHSKELTLRVNDKAITFKVRHTSRYSRNFYEELVNRIDVIDVSCEEYAQEVLGFSDSSMSGNPTPSDPIIASFSPSFTPFEGSYFILEEIETFLRTPDVFSTLDDDFDPDRDIALIENFLNEDPSLNLPPMKNEDLKQADVTMTKSLIEEPLELELKDLPSRLEYAFLEITNKLPVIISKKLKYEEKAALLKVLKSHKRDITWKISDIKGIDPRFCTHKILMEDDFKPVVQHQRRVNLKIYEVIKKEVIKLLDAELIYPISDSPWVSPVYYGPKNDGMTVVENEDRYQLD